MKEKLIAGLVIALAAAGLKILSLKSELETRWQQNSRSYMLIQAAYQEGLRQNCAEVEKLEEVE